MVLDGVLLDQFRQFAIRITPGCLVEGAAGRLDRSIRFRVHPAEGVIAIGVIRARDAGRMIRIDHVAVRFQVITTVVDQHIKIA